MLPLPAVINGSTSDSQIITGSLAPISSAVGGLNLHQVPYDFDTLITELMIKVVQQHVSLNQVVTTIPSVSSSTSSASRSTTASSATTPATEDDPGSFDVPLDLTDLIWILIIGVLLLLVFFARRILRILHWLEEKSWGLIIGVFGAFYNVHDRILDQNQVLLNQSRSNIMLYLEHMSHYGAHLREIKSTLKMGTGILLWHLQVLEEFGWVNQHQIGRYKIFIAYDYSVDFNPEQKKLELELRSKYTKVIIETLIAVEESVTLTLTEFSQKVSADRKIIRKHLDVLDHADAIEVQKEGVMTTIFIVDKELIENLLGGIQLRESFSTDPTVSVESTN
jgi:predicted transcriptional regulator